MYRLCTEESFDSAHFLKDYIGKCSNIHGHRWRVVAEIKSKTVCESGQTRGMVIDFGDFKGFLRVLTEELDHKLIVEKDSLKPALLAMLREENFAVAEVDFRPTAEEFARYFYMRFKDEGYPISCVTVYETPNNCAVYSMEEE